MPQGVNEITILGLDPSTDDTGLAIIRFNRQSAVQLLLAANFIATATHRNSKTARVKRIIETQDDLHRVFCNEAAPMRESIGVVAYEWHTERNPDVSEALSMAAGAYLTTCLLQLPDTSICRIRPVTAKAMYGGAHLRREDAKPAAIQWARKELGLFGLSLTDTDDAIADACAVCFAAWSQWRQSLLVEKPMMGRGSRGPRKAVAG